MKAYFTIQRGQPLKIYTCKTNEVMDWSIATDKQEQLTWIYNNNETEYEKENVTLKFDSLDEAIKAFEAISGKPSTKSDIERVYGID